MKKTILSLLMLLGTTVVVAQNVATAEALKAAVEADPAAQITLTDDIDVSELGKLCETFIGTIEGTITSGRGKALIGATVPLFDRLKGATLKNIVIQRFDIYNWKASQHAVQDDGYSCYGMIACVASDGCKFENVLIEKSDIRCDCSMVGGLVGSSKGSTFLDCSADNQSTFFSKVPIDKISYLGSLVGNSDNDTFTNCVTGALVANYGSVSYIGGMAGCTTGTRMESCLNHGIVVSVDDANYETIFERYKTGNLTSTPMRHRGKEYDVQSLYDLLLEDISYGTYMGGLVGRSSSCDFVDCVNLGPCYYGLDEGGIVGYANESNLDCCTNYGSIYGKVRIGQYNDTYHPNRGGIAGSTYNSHITNCLNFGTFPGMDDYCAGLVYNVKEGSISNCLSLVADVPVYKITKDLSEESGNNYVLGTGFGGDETLAFVSEKMLKSGIVAYWLNKGIGNHDRDVKPWRQNIGQDDSPVLDADHDAVEYENLAITISDISTPEQFKTFAKVVNTNDGAFVNVRLTADIDLGDLGSDFIVGNERFPYRGIFDGAGHTITLKMESTSGATGIFGTLGTYAEIRNLTLGAGSQIKGGSAGTGGIAGGVKTLSKRGFVTIENCANKGVVIADGYAGGILGTVDCDEKVKIYVDKCYSTGDVKVRSGHSALLCGYMKNSGVVTNSYAYARLQTLNAGVAPFGVSGQKYPHFVGYDQKLDISKCYTFDSEENVDEWQRSKLQDGVFEYPSAMLKNGNFVYLLNGETNDPAAGLIWQQNLGDYPEPGSKGLYHTRQVSNQYGTICLPYTLQSNDDIQYYTFSSVKSDEGKVSLHFESATEVAASKPALFCVKTTGTYSFDDVNKDHVFFINDTDQTGWNMCGTFEKKVFEGDAAKSIYYVSNGAIHNASQTTISPYRAYIVGPSIDELKGNSGQAKAIRFVLEDENGETTSIDPVALGSLSPERAGGESSYSLMGTKVSSGYRGIVIQNGKKYVRN